MTPLLTAIGWLDLLWTTLFAGGILYATVVAAPSAPGRRAIYWAAALLALTFPLELGMTAVRLGPLTSADGPSLLWKLLGTQWGGLWVARCVGLAALVACRLGSPLQAGLAALWLLAHSVQGHAGAHGAFPSVVDWIHLLAASAWVGGLLQIALCPAPAIAGVARRFSRLALAAIAALIPSGVYGAVLHVPHLEELIDSPYGRTLLIKGAVAIVLLALGATNHFLHVPALQQHDGSAAGRLKQMVRVEVAVGAVVLLLSALLGVLPMPHAPPR